MFLVLTLAVCFSLLFLVEVFLGGPLPVSGGEGLRFGRMPVGEFFGQALPLAAVGIGIPMSPQYPWALALVGAGVALHVLVCRMMRAC